MGFPALGGEPDRLCRCQAFDAALPKAHAALVDACTRLYWDARNLVSDLETVRRHPERGPELLEQYCQQGDRYGVLESQASHTRTIGWALARLEEAQPEESEAQP